MRIEYHRTLIADHVRNAAIYAALKHAIVPGETVVADIGAGTGLIGMMAAGLGAREVYLYECAGVVEAAHAAIERNRLANCHLMSCHSTEMLDPPRVDLVVSETLGNYALEENIIATLNDARARFLKPGGRVIPERVHQFMAPVTEGRFHGELCAWDDVGYGLDLSRCKLMSLNNVYVRTIEPAALADPSGRVWDVVDLGRSQKSTRKGEASWTFDAPTLVFGVCVWWEAELGGGISLSTAPGSDATHWEQLYFPVVDPMKVPAGVKLRAQIRSRSSEDAGTHLSWSLSTLNAEGKVTARQSMDLDKGYLP